MKLFVVVLFVFSSIVAGSALYVQVDANEKLCFHELVEKTSTKIIFAFQVIEGGFLDISTSVRDPQNHLLWEAAKLSNAVRTFNDPQLGKYSFCFNNTMSTFTPKLVKFDVKVIHDDLPTNASNLDLMVADLRAGLQQVKMEQSYMSERLDLHLQLKDATNSKVFWFTLFHDTLMLIICLIQMFCLTQFFSVTRRV